MSAYQKSDKYNGLDFPFSERSGRKNGEDKKSINTIKRFDKDPIQIFTSAHKPRTQKSD